MVKGSSLAQLRNKSPRQFEEYIALLLPELGYTNVSLTNLTADSGYDIEAYKNNEKVLFECKKYSEHNKVGSRDIRIFADACNRMNTVKGIFITTSSFTRTVYQEQHARTIEIEFWDGKELLRQIKSKKQIPAYCIICKKKIKGRTYRHFDWKEKIFPAKSPFIAEPYIYSIGTHLKFRKSDLDSLLPAQPLLCESCSYFTKCSECGKEIDVRDSEQTKYHLKKYYCTQCWQPLNRKSNREVIYFLTVLLSLIIGGAISGIYMLIYLEDKTWGIFPLAGVAFLIIWIIKELFIKKET